VRLWRNPFGKKALIEALVEPCDRLQFQPVLVESKHELAGQACLKYGGWQDTAKAEFLVRQGLAIIQTEQNVKEAAAKFKEAQKYQPEIDLNPDTKEIDKDPLTVAQKLTKLLKVKEVESLAEAGKYKEALVAYQEAVKLDPQVEISATVWNGICWFGSLDKQAKDVLLACENAVKLASPKDKSGYQDSRGVAKALTGDTSGAIADFEVFIADPSKDESEKDQRQKWIEALKKGENPFTDEVLEKLKYE
jgi:tetratricopeptide (TPR) repeat protein